MSSEYSWPQESYDVARAPILIELLRKPEETDGQGLRTRYTPGREQRKRRSRLRRLYQRADDIFYWMEDRSGGEIPLGAIWIDIPTGCRFCC